MRIEVELDEGLTKVFGAVCKRYNYTPQQGLMMAVAVFNLWARVPTDMKLMLQNERDGTLVEFPLQP